MTSTGKPFGFATIGHGAAATDRPAAIPTPSVYDFTNGKRPEIADADRPHLKRGSGPEAGSVLPTPPVRDFNRRGGKA